MSPLDVLPPVGNPVFVFPILSLLVAAYNLVPDFGLAIVLVTILIRLALYPLFRIQIQNQRAMQELAPAMHELKAKYGSDRQRLGQEQMKLYQERGYNPAMGCLPLLLQMPLLFALYAALSQAPNIPADQWIYRLLPFVSPPDGGHLDLAAHWLPWLSSLAEKSNPFDVVHLFGAPSLTPGGMPDPPGAGIVPVALAERFGLAVLPLLAGGLQLASSIMFQPSVQPKNIDPQQKMMQSMQYYFPLLTVWFATQFPAGLAIYWVTTTLFGIVQQYFVSGWGQLPRFLPFLKRIPSPADRTLAARQRAALEEERRDMSSRSARAPLPANGPSVVGAQNTRQARRPRNRNKKK